MFYGSGLFFLLGSCCSLLHSDGFWCLCCPSAPALYILKVVLACKMPSGSIRSKGRMHSLLLMLRRRKNCFLF